MPSLKSRLWSRRSRNSSLERDGARSHDDDAPKNSTTSRRQRRFSFNRKAHSQAAAPTTTTRMLDVTVTSLADRLEKNDDHVVNCMSCKGRESLNEMNAVDTNGSTLLRMLQVNQLEQVKTNRELTLEFMKCYNNHDLKAARAMVTDDYHTVFGEHEMKWDDLAMETQKIFDAFPDYRFTFQKIEEKGDDVVILHHFIPCGTHTGTAYAFGPCEPIEPTGKYVRNDPEEVHFTFRDGKICRNAVFSDGELIGPAGIYVQIGGFPML